MSQVRLRYTHGFEQAKKRAPHTLKVQVKTSLSFTLTLTTHCYWWEGKLTTYEKWELVKWRKRDGRAPGLLVEEEHRSFPQAALELFLSTHSTLDLFERQLVLAKLAADFEQLHPLTRSYFLASKRDGKATKRFRKQVRSLCRAMGGRLW